VVNGQSRTDEVTIGKTGTFEPVVTNLKAWTDVVISYASATLGQGQGGAGTKMLGFQVIGAHMYQGAYASLVPVLLPNCEVVLDVTAGNGYRAEYRAAAKKGYSWTAACEDATREVTTQVFQDFQILRYLTQ
jgi:hypothetical protein